MAATRNGSVIRLGNIAIQPAAPRETLKPRPPVAGVTTTANVPPAQSLSGQTTSLSPLTALQRTETPYTEPAVTFRLRSTPLRQLVELGLDDEILTLDQYTYANGQTVLDTSKLRCDLIALTKYVPIYSSDGETPSLFGRYLTDLYQTSIVQDVLRRYLLLNKSVTDPTLAGTLGSISARVNQDITEVTLKLATLDTLIQKVKELNEVLDFKGSLQNSLQAPYRGLQAFVTQNMLFSEQSYNTFADTKVAYQLLFDLGGMLEKCSFNLLDSFTDYDRAVHVTTPVTVAKQTVQDSITLDLTYGDNLRYTPAVLQNKLVSNYAAFNGVLSSLPALGTDRFKLILNILSKEFRVSMGLGKNNLPEEAGFFGFGNRGNPFDNIIGSVPSDIFLAPLGQNSLSTLFYIRTDTQNAVILPLEARQVAGDGETVFVPGATYFGDGILRNDLSLFRAYRERFSERVANAETVFNSLLFDDNKGESSVLTPVGLLNTALVLFSKSLQEVRKDGNDANALLSLVLFMVGIDKPNAKFEVYKLLLLLVLYSTREVVSQQANQTNDFESLLLSELSSGTVQGFSEPVTEQSLAVLLDNQIATVKSILLENISTDAGGTPTLLQPNSTTTSSRNPVGNTARVQIQQLSQFIDIINEENNESNIFKNILDLAKRVFAAANPYHLTEGSSATRYHGLTITGFLLLVFELFSSLVEQFGTPNIRCSLADGEGDKLDNSTEVVITFLGSVLSEVEDDITKLNSPAGTCDNAILNDYKTKLAEEDEIIKNILFFFRRLNDNFSKVTSPTINESNLRGTTGDGFPTSLSTIRTAKGIFKRIQDKTVVYNPQGSSNSSFYLPAGKAVTDKNWTALQYALADAEFLSEKNLIATVGVPAGFVDAALGAKLNKDDAYNGALQSSGTDIVDIKVYKLDKNDEGIIYQPQSFKFDLSLFPKGFDACSKTQIQGWNNQTLPQYFLFYDFDEDISFNFVGQQDVEELVERDGFYRVSDSRKNLGREVVRNLYRSFIFDLYTHMLTGLNTGEETFTDYTEDETTRFMNALVSAAGGGTASLVGIKLMSPEYQGLLSAFAGNPEDTKLMLTLCNDIPSTVLRKKNYDRTFNVMFDSTKFAVDVDAMSQNPEGQKLLELLYGSGVLFEAPDGQTYKTATDFELAEYFINMELVQ